MDTRDQSFCGARNLTVGSWLAVDWCLNLSTVLTHVTLNMLFPLSEAWFPLLFDEVAFTGYKKG